MKIKKIFYYLKSLLLLFNNSYNKVDFVLFFIGRRTYYIFNNKVKFKIKSLLDLLILKETVIDDFYRLKKTVSKNPKIIVDIGGGFGDFSIYAAKMYQNAKIFVFEPNPILYQLLKQNVRTSKAKNIFMYPLAISNKRELSINISGELTKTSSFFDLKTSKKIITVKTESLSILLKQQTIDFLKIDCEGGEWDILSNLSDQEMDNIKIISLEYHNQYMESLDKKLIKKLINHFTILHQPDPYDKNIGHIYATKK